jgi:hypothetical protein
MLWRASPPSRSELRFMKQSPNSPCWCGSGKKFKKCHYGREEAKSIPFAAVRSQIAEATALKTCLHPKASDAACDRIASGHTLQRSRVLKAIAKHGHVLTFYPMDFDQSNTLRVHRRGWKKSSTFYAFCKHHDDSAFAKLEKYPFEGTSEQRFLLAYRAVCWELYQKLRAVEAQPVMRELVDRGKPLQEQVVMQSLLAGQSDGFAQGLKDIRATKHALDRLFLAESYDHLAAFELRIEGDASIVSTGCINPTNTLQGIELPGIQSRRRAIEWLAFGCDRLADGSIAVVFAWNPDQAPVEHLMAQIAALDDDALCAFVPQFFFAHCENTYFASCWWEALPCADKAFIRMLMSNLDPYGNPPTYEFDRRVTNWRIVERRSHPGFECEDMDA